MRLNLNVMLCVSNVNPDLNVELYVIKKNFSRLINDIFIPIACFLGSWFSWGGGHGECSNSIWK